MMSAVFNIVYRVLKGLSLLTGFDYYEINIITYYIAIPMIYLLMIDRIIKRHVFKIVFPLAVLLIAALVDFREFSHDLFAISVRFLRWFRVIGLNYVASSVVICVIVPFLAFLVLFYFSYWPDLKKLVAGLLDRMTSSKAQKSL